MVCVWLWGYWRKSYLIYDSILAKLWLQQWSINSKFCWVVLPRYIQYIYIYTHICVFYVLHLPIISHKNGICNISTKICGFVITIFADFCVCVWTGVAAVIKCADFLFSHTFRRSSAGRILVTCECGGGQTRTVQSVKQGIGRVHCPRLHCARHSSWSSRLLLPSARVRVRKLCKTLGSGGRAETGHQG